MIDESEPVFHNCYKFYLRFLPLKSFTNVYTSSKKKKKKEKKKMKAKYEKKVEATKNIQHWRS